MPARQHRAHAYAVSVIYLWCGAGLRAVLLLHEFVRQERHACQSSTAALLSTIGRLQQQELTYGLLTFVLAFAR
jgi:hypothetical protein